MTRYGKPRHLESIGTLRNEKQTIGVRAVYQRDTATNTLLHTLIPKDSHNELTNNPGTFAYIYATKQLFVYLVGGGDPTDKVVIHAPTAVHRGIGIGRVNGTDLRLLCHNYMYSSGAYDDSTFATFSPDGKLVMFRSNMGKAGGRYDVFVAEVPITSGGGGGCEGSAGVAGGSEGGAIEGGANFGPPQCEP